MKLGHSRCDLIVALIDACLAELEGQQSTGPLDSPTDNDTAAAPRFRGPRLVTEGTSFMYPTLTYGLVASHLDHRLADADNHRLVRRARWSRTDRTFRRRRASSALSRPVLVASSRASLDLTGDGS